MGQGLSGVLVNFNKGNMSREATEEITFDLVLEDK